MPICVPVSNCRKCGISVHKALRIYFLMLKNWCDGDLYITVTAQEFFQEPAMNMFSKKWTKIHKIINFNAISAAGQN